VVPKECLCSALTMNERQRYVFIGSTSHRNVALHDDALSHNEGCQGGAMLMSATSFLHNRNERRSLCFLAVWPCARVFLSFHRATALKSRSRALSHRTNNDRTEGQGRHEQTPQRIRASVLYGLREKTDKSMDIEIEDRSSSLPFQPQC